MVKSAPVGKTRKKALGLLGRLGPMPAIDFAREMWPNSKAWAKPHIMNWSASNYLQRLVDAGFVSKTEFGFMLNAAGLDLRDKLFPLAD